MGECGKVKAIDPLSQVSEISRIISLNLGTQIVTSLNVSIEQICLRDIFGIYSNDLLMTNTL